MHCLVSIVIREWSAVHAEVQAQKRLLLGRRRRHDLPRPPIFAAATGCLLVVDWDGGRVLAGLPLPSPPASSSMADACRSRCGRAIGSSPSKVRRSRSASGTLLQPRTHARSNAARALVSSSGPICWPRSTSPARSCGSTSCLSTATAGRASASPRVRSRAQRNRRYLPAALTTHPNSALALPDGGVLATLFSTGELVRIARPDGAPQVLLSGAAPTARHPTTTGRGLHALRYRRRRRGAAR